MNDTRLEDLLRPRDFCRCYPMLCTEGQLRWWLYNGEINGLNASGAVIRLGRSVWLDVPRFRGWLLRFRSAQAA